MADEDVRVKIEPFEEVIIDETALKEEPETKESVFSAENSRRISSAEKAEIVRQIGRMQQLNREKEVTGHKIEATDAHIFRFNVALVRGRSAEKVWRQIQIPACYTFRDFHIAIQKAMGWKSIDYDYHLHRFNIVNIESGDEEAIVMSEYEKVKKKAKDENVTKLRDYFKAFQQKATYVYDFGIMWTHEIVFEDFFLPEQDAKYPKCVAGQGECPPEDGVESTDDDDD